MQHMGEALGVRVHPLAGAGLRGAALAPARVVCHVVAGERQPGRRGCVAPPRACTPVVLPLAALALAHNAQLLVGKAA